MQRILEGIYKKGYFDEKAGVPCLDLVPGTEKQARLCRAADRSERERSGDSWRRWTSSTCGAQDGADGYGRDAAEVADAP